MFLLMCFLHESRKCRKITYLLKLLFDLCLLRILYLNYFIRSNILGRNNSRLEIAVQICLKYFLYVVYALELNVYNYNNRFA